MEGRRKKHRYTWSSNVIGNYSFQHFYLRTIYIQWLQCKFSWSINSDTWDSESLYQQRWLLQAKHCLILSCAQYERPQCCESELVQSTPASMGLFPLTSVSLWSAFSMWVTWETADAGWYSLFKCYRGHRTHDKSWHTNSDATPEFEKH